MCKALQDKLHQQAAFDLTTHLAQSQAFASEPDNTNYSSYDKEQSHFGYDSLFTETREFVNVWGLFANRFDNNSAQNWFWATINDPKLIKYFLPDELSNEQRAIIGPKLQANAEFIGEMLRKANVEASGKGHPVPSPKRDDTRGTVINANQTPNRDREAPSHATDTTSSRFVVSDVGSSKVGRSQNDKSSVPSDQEAPAYCPTCQNPYKPRVKCPYCRNLEAQEQFKVESNGKRYQSAYASPFNETPELANVWDVIAIGCNYNTARDRFWAVISDPSSIKEFVPTNFGDDQKATLEHRFQTDAEFIGEMLRAAGFEFSGGRAPTLNLEWDDTRETRMTAARTLSVDHLTPQSVDPSRTTDAANLRFELLDVNSSRGARWAANNMPLVPPDQQAAELRRRVTKPISNAEKKRRAKYRERLGFKPLDKQ